MKLKLYSIIIIFFCFATVYAQDKKQPVSTFAKTKGFENASLGFCVMDKNGKVLYQLNKDRSLTPASILKIVTTATALETLGENFRFKTELFVNTSTNWISVVGSGDPTLGSEYIDTPATGFLEKWTTEVKKHIDKESPINIFIDDSCFGYNGISKKWLWEDMGSYYASGSYGVSIFDNMYKLFLDVQDTDSTSQPKILRTEPPMPNLEFTNTMTLNSSGKNNGYILGQPFSNSRILMGNIPASRKSFSMRGDIPDPGLYLGYTLANKFIESNLLIGGVVSKRIEPAPMMSDNKLIYTHLSPNLKNIVRIINEKSNNHYTEHLIRRFGCDATQPDGSDDALAKGIDYTKKYWKEKGVDTKPLFMYDGCGVAPSNAVSPMFMCNLLHYMQTKSKSKEAFFLSLPLAGKEGTVRNLLKGTQLEGKVHVKSGSIANVQCFSGYVVKDKEVYSFAVMVNNFTCERRDVVKAIQKLLLEIF